MKHVIVVVLVCLLFGLVMPNSFAQTASQDVAYLQAKTDDGLLTFAFPEDWTIDTDVAGIGNIGIVSDKAILENEGVKPLESGQVSVLLSFLDSNVAVENGLVGDTLTDKLELIMNNMSLNFVDADGNSLVDAGEVQLVDATDLTVAYAQVSYSIEGANYTLILWNLADGLLGTALVGTAGGEWDEYAPIVINIVQSVRYLGDEYQQIVREIQD